MCVGSRIGVSFSDVSEISMMMSELRCLLMLGGVKELAAAWRGCGTLCWRIVGGAGLVASGL